MRMTDRVKGLRPVDEENRENVKGGGMTVENLGEATKSGVDKE